MRISPDVTNVFCLYYAPAGTAGNAITWNTLFCIDNNGNANITGNLTIGGNINISGTLNLTEIDGGNANG